MHLNGFSAGGFRSLSQVESIPVSSPTILAGHNDGGKSAVLTALAFLLGVYRLTDEDRTYVTDGTFSGQRSAETWVEGDFTLDAEERGGRLAERVRIRRRAASDEEPRWEYLGQQPADPRLRDLERLLKPALGDLVRDYALQPTGALKDDLLAAVAAYADSTAQVEGWQPLPKPLVARLPRLLYFSGTDESPDDAVRTALASCYENHLEDENLQGHVREIEADITQRLEKDADSLCAHIRLHCADFVGVAVQPEVSFRSGFKRAPLLISRADGEPVDLARSGQGSARRIALAIWEWTSNILESAELAAAGEPGAEPPTQTIVVYDEPDTHLDYRHQRTVMDIIRKQCGVANVNVMVATHSMNLIDGVDIADVVHLKLDHGRTVVERLGDDTHDGINFHLGQIAAALGLRNSVLLHERCFLAVEGDTEQYSVPLLFRLSQGMSLQAAGIALWGCENNEGALHLASYLVKHQRTVRLMVDADSRTNKHFKIERLERTGLDLATQVSYVGEAEGYNELEELFSDDQWAGAANAHWPRPPGQTWSAEDFTAHRGGKFSGNILSMIKERADTTSPNGKPAMVYGLATTLTAPSDVPSQLRAIFGELCALAH